MHVSFNGLSKHEINPDQNDQCFQSIYLVDTVICSTGNTVGIFNFVSSALEKKKLTTSNKCVSMTIP
jgi:hypothetical protein